MGWSNTEEIRKEEANSGFKVSNWPDGMTLQAAWG